MYDEKNVLDPLGLDADVIVDDDDLQSKQETVSDEAGASVSADETADTADAVNGASVEETAESAVEEKTEEAAAEETLESDGSAPTDACEESAEEAEADGETAQAAEALEEAATEAAPEEAEAAVVEPEPVKVLVEFSREEFTQLISNHFSAVAYAINALRSKDDSITRLSKEVQKYREDYCVKSFKPIAMTMIGLRESCRKSLASLDKPLDFVKVKKFVNFLAEDVDDLMSDIGLECEKENGYIWTYNGTPLFKKSVETVTFSEGFELCENPSLVLPELGESFTEYLEGCEAAVHSALSEMSKYDKCINDYIKVARAIDEGILAANVYPVLRGLVHFAPRFKADVIEGLNVLTEENAIEVYKTLLEELTDKLGELLCLGGVEVEAIHGGLYDLKKHKIIKLIPTDDESLDRTVESVSTDCYSLGGLVISQAKINAFKYQPSNG